MSLETKPIDRTVHAQDLVGAADSVELAVSGATLQAGIKALDTGIKTVGIYKDARTEQLTKELTSDFEDKWTTALHGDGTEGGEEIAGLSVAEKEASRLQRITAQGRGANTGLTAYNTGKQLLLAQLLAMPENKGREREVHTAFAGMFSGSTNAGVLAANDALRKEERKNAREDRHFLRDKMIEEGGVDPSLWFEDEQEFWRQGNLGLAKAAKVAALALDKGLNAPDFLREVRTVAVPHYAKQGMLALNEVLAKMTDSRYTDLIKQWPDIMSDPEVDHDMLNILLVEDHRQTRARLVNDLLDNKGFDMEVVDETLASLDLRYSTLIERIGDAEALKYLEDENNMYNAADLSRNPDIRRAIHGAPLAKTLSVTSEGRGLLGEQANYLADSGAWEAFVYGSAIPIPATGDPLPEPGDDVLVTLGTDLSQWLREYIGFGQTNDETNARATIAESVRKVLQTQGLTPNQYTTAVNGTHSLIVNANKRYEAGNGTVPFKEAEIILTALASDSYRETVLANRQDFQDHAVDEISAFLDTQVAVLVYDARILADTHGAATASLSRQIQKFSSQSMLRHPEATPLYSEELETPAPLYTMNLQVEVQDDKLVFVSGKSDRQGELEAAWQNAGQGMPTKPTPYQQEAIDAKVASLNNDYGELLNLLATADYNTQVNHEDAARSLLSFSDYVNKRLAIEGAYQP